MSVFPKISIITIAYNAAFTIEKTILSVIQQTYTDFEYIIIDGGSTDETIQIIKKYESHLSFWISEPDRGISNAFNKGIAKAKGEYIQLLNAGDVFINHTILEEISPKINDTIVSFKSKYGSLNRYIPSSYNTNSHSLIDKTQLSHQATFVNKSIYNKYGDYNEFFKIRMDYEFFVRVLKFEQVSFIDKAIINYDYGGVSSTNATRFVVEGLIVEYQNKLINRFHFMVSLIWKPFAVSLKLKVRNYIFSKLNK